MTQREDQPKGAGDLRQRAEALAREGAAGATEAPAALSPEELRRTLHELRVHQIELEMQNEELRRAQAEIDAARARYFDLYDLAPAGYCTLSAEGLILEANLTLATLLGLARGALVKQPVSRFIFQEDQDLYYLHRKKLLETGEPQDCELRLVEPDGAPFWAQLKGTVARAEDGAPLCRVMISDITERKRAEHALEESRLYSESLLRTIPFPMDIVDEEGQVLFLSDKLQALVDERTLGEHCWTHYRDTKQQCDNCPLKREIAIGQTQVIETSDLLGGRSFEVFHTGMIFQGKRALLEIFIDVTEKKRLQIRLAQSDRLSIMGTLAAGIAHEINNPLSYVLYNIESLSQEVPKLAEVLRRCHAALRSQVGAEALNELVGAEGDSFGPAMFDDVAARLGEVLSGTIRIRDLARGLGTFSRVERSEVAPVDLQHAAEQAINLAFAQIKYRARFVKDFGQVPLVLGSDGKLAQVFLNLLINAAQAIDEGQAEHHEIRIRTWAEGEAVFAEVSDTGRGIAPEQQGRIFEPFYTTKEVGLGSGLGLSISRNIVTGFGGEISFSSEPGRGTRFLIRLPRLPRDWQPQEASTQEDAPPRSTTRGRILVVDDEQGIRSIIARMLGRRHEVLTAASGEEARAILEQDQRFDLILCDLMMPRISGMELHAWLAERDADLAAQLVFMTGGAFTAGATEYLAKVGNLLIEKPFDIVSFKKLTDELILAARAKRDRRS